MNDLENREQQIETLKKQLENTGAELINQRQLVKSLESELAETNRGVVALYSELETYSEKLKEASELKSRFLTYMSHEFRTPLGSMQSIAKILLDRLDGDLSEEQEKQVKFIEKAALELTEMVNDLLDLAKVEAGHVTIAPAWFEMVDLFSAIRGLFKPIIAQSKVMLVFEEPGDVSRLLYTDDTKLSLILRNLVSNALKFTSRGEVRVSAVDAENDYVKFSVKDTGIGIASEHLSALFNDWVQIGSATQKRLRGSGLGLSLCKRYSELLGGSIFVQSELGVGSEFSVTIPRILAGHTANL
ncbi:MAG TPA: ATP-binding protein, partial [Pirellula sp.]|nr:ATP-binding protein [Pirellula sp.]